MLDTSELDELLSWMRSNRVSHARLGQLELHADLGEPDFALDSAPELPRVEDRGNPYLDPDLWGDRVPPHIKAMLAKPTKGKGETDDMP